MAKYFITSSRCIGGQYVFASPENPAEIELPDDMPVDPGLLKAPPEKPTPHFAKGGSQTAADAFGAPKAGKGRASDRSI